MNVEVEGLVELCPHVASKIKNNKFFTTYIHVQIFCDVVQMIVLSDLWQIFLFHQHQAKIVFAFVLMKCWQI